jgi:hypothetical protein
MKAKCPSSGAPSSASRDARRDTHPGFLLPKRPNLCQSNKEVFKLLDNSSTNIPYFKQYRLIKSIVVTTYFLILAVFV